MPHIRIRSLVLLATVAVTAAALAGWKQHSLQAAEAAGASQPEYSELVSAAYAHVTEYHPSTIAVGTVVALRSVTVSNEVAGTVRQATLHPGAIVEAGSVLLALDVSVEQAELKAQQAKSRLADTRLPASASEKPPTNRFAKPAESLDTIDMASIYLFSGRSPSQ